MSEERRVLKVKINYDDRGRAISTETKYIENGQVKTEVQKVEPEAPATQAIETAVSGSH